MAPRYIISPSSYYINQGEIMCNLYEINPDISEADDFPNVATSLPVYPTPHLNVIVVTQDCDLKQDRDARNTAEPDESKLLTHIQFCELFLETEIRSSRGLTSQPWKRVNQNQDERFHHLYEETIDDGAEHVPDLYADFKRIFSLPVEYTYQLLEKGGVTRKVLLQDPYLRDFVQRLHSFLSRVPLPEITVTELE